MYELALDYLYRDYMKSCDYDEAIDLRSEAIYMNHPEKIMEHSKWQDLPHDDTLEDHEELAWEIAKLIAEKEFKGA